MSRLNSILSKDNLSKKDLIYLLSLSDEKDIEELFKWANDLTIRNLGNEVYLRGLIEFSNVCSRDCKYCGIRKSNGKVNRYTMENSEIIKAARWIYKRGFGSLVLQSGERSDSRFIEWVDHILKEIKNISNGELGITLSVGEQTQETYKQWFDSGAHRYLLRVETTNQELYQKIHPAGYQLNQRIEALERIQKCHYQVGTGVMIGLPGQTIEDLADDIIFMKQKDIDMIGMGPYIPHDNTPMAKLVKNFNPEKQLQLALKMIAVTRIYLKDVNIASTTALGALDQKGKRKGLECGANVIMPNLTPDKYQKEYKLYANKPEFLASLRKDFKALKSEIKAAGKNIGFNKWGDSPHYFKRTKKERIEN
ncbi:MAG: [FeFe] hydrogenase H-cluster radical SAM maturase HydE [Candidatus Marinimicrobia bacterium]|nr:[FeFe] hydrogenase H-cluster radical SAM maturase HydE [Candidatus Neomarinimicrobiota bacterium]